MERSQYVEGLFSALADAQGEIANAEKSSDNPFFKSKYADLAEVLNCVRPVFSRYGLGILQLPTTDKGTATVETIITYRQSGQFISEKLSAEIGGKKDVQAMGATITYLRRYALSAMAGIAQEDDDGNGVSGKKEPVNGDQLPPSPAIKAHAEADYAVIAADYKADFDRTATSSALAIEWWGDNGKLVDAKLPANSEARKKLMKHMGGVKAHYLKIELAAKEAANAQ